MGFNPAALMKLMSARNKFVNAHPKVSAFIGRELQDIPAGTVIELSITKPGKDPVVTNMRVTEEDLEFIRSLRDLQS